MIIVVLIACLNFGFYLWFCFYIKKLIFNEHQRLITRFLMQKCPFGGMGAVINAMQIEQASLKDKINALTSDVEEVKERERVVSTIKRQKEKPVKIKGFTSNWPV